MKPSIIKGFELKADMYRLELDVAPKGFDISSLETHTVEYFKKYGFRYSSLVSELYYRYNGIKSEKYIPASLYYYYIAPYLIKMDFVHAFDDKCIYSKLFPNMKQPATVMKNMNGRLYVSCNSSYNGEKELPVNEAVEYLKGKEKCVIKPTMEGGGRGVQLFDFGNSSTETIQKLLDEYKSGFIIQKPVKNSDELKKLNPTSLNTCRIYTYRRVDSSEYVVLGSAIRFGGKGAFRDNACSGGGFCRINNDGLLDDTIYRYGFFEKGSLKQDKGINSLYIPQYDKMVECCKALHSCLPYCDLVGWDITEDEEGDLILIEYNYAADSEFLQIFNGPAFGEYTDELMEKISQPTSEEMIAIRRSFVNAPEKSMVIDMKKVGDL